MAKRLADSAVLEPEASAQLTVRKQVGRGLFMRTVAQMDSVNGALSKLTLLAQMEAEYPVADGWEIITVAFTGQSPEGWTFAVWLGQYVDA